ncbi:hypothetical protein [Bacillus sp. 1P06AnD]|uniref:hypothetical protein n=1 Tax=Bacillus sp. 1P06AnD TaxID=3132208 RepID=UPI0039A030AC
MNKFFVLSLLTVVMNIVFFFVFRGPNASILTMIGVASILSLAGIIFSTLSKNIFSIIGGLLLNGLGLAYAFLLLMAVGIGGL